MAEAGATLAPDRRHRERSEATQGSGTLPTVALHCFAPLAMTTRAQNCPRKGIHTPSIAGGKSQKNQFGEIATPHGSRPTGMLFTTFSASTSITETSFDVPLVVKSCFWSGVKASCQTRWPTGRYFCTS